MATYNDSEDISYQSDVDTNLMISDENNSGTESSQNASIASSPAPSASQTPSRASSRAPKARRTLTRNKDIWQHSRGPLPGVELARHAQSNRLIWYCKYCPSYNVVSTSAAYYHLQKEHKEIELKMPYEKKKGVTLGVQQEVKALFGNAIKKKQAETVLNTQRDLLNAIDHKRLRRALVRLIIRRDLPHGAVHWPELHTLLLTVNFMAKEVIPKTNKAIYSDIEATFHAKRLLVRDFLHRTQSLHHLTTDTWHAPNHVELQAINVHCVVDNKPRKALLNLVELDNGHSGEEVAKHILRVLDWYGIKDTLGFITSDNATCNDKMHESLAPSLAAWDKDDFRLRCLGHIINLATSAFLYAKDKAAVDEAERQCAVNGIDLEEQMALAAMPDLVEIHETADGKTGSWHTILPLRRLYLFTVKLNRSSKLTTAFKRLTKGRTIHRPNATRWHSWHDCIATAYALRFELSQFIADNSLDYPDLALMEPSAEDWRVLRLTEQFLAPFREVCKRAEGDTATLDQVQEHCDFLVAHFDQWLKDHKDNKPFITALLTGWYCLDKWYQHLDAIGAYAAAVLLHPNKRRAYLLATWKAAWVTKGVRRAENLWQVYYESHQQEQEHMDYEDNSGEEPSAFVKWQRQQASRIKAKSKDTNQWQRFINTTPDSIAFNKSYTVLDWWLEHSQQRSYPQLSRMAVDILSAPPMSAEAERVFSRARRQVPWTRMSLQGHMIGMTECLKSWQIEGIADDDIDTELVTRSMVAVEAEEGIEEPIAMSIEQ